MRFAIEGLIENVGAADIFLFLGQTQRTSVVAFERPDQETRVFFVDGQPVSCVSTKVQLQLEARLAAGGALKLRDIELAMGRQNAGANRIPQILIAELMATEASIEKDIKALALEALRDVATWTSGTFTVYDGVTPPPWAHLIAPDFPTLLIEALRGQCQKEALQKEFVSRKGILKARSVSRSSAALSDPERTVLALVNGERTIEDIVKRSSLDEHTALSAMHVLCALHLTDLLPPQRAGKPSPDRAPQGAPPQGPSPAPAGPAGGDLGGPTNKYTAQQIEAQRLAGSPAEVTPKVPEPAVRTADSTAKLHPIPDLGVKPKTRLLRVTAEDKTEDVPLATPTFAIGRHPRNDLVLKDPRISSFHCRVEIEGDKHVILDLKSRNGTLLNSARVDRAVLKHNDQIQLGSTKIAYIES
ncbi:MAG: FHA domain-containing protein [Vicinamibacteria bacterium]|nr:FHA domain-containing protein [Vicinamibacteria bacterium]